MYENWKILKSELPYREKEYAEVAQWCNESGYHIKDDGINYKVVKNEISEETLKILVRSVRDSYLKEKDFTQLPDAPFATEEKLLYKQYREYLRNYTQKENWWLENPKTFKEWKE